MESDTPVETDTEASSSASGSPASDNRVRRRSSRRSKRPSDDQEYTTAAKPKDNDSRRSSKRQKRAVTITPQLRSSNFLKPEPYSRRASSPASTMSEVVTVRPESPTSPHARKPGSKNRWPSRIRKHESVQDDQHDQAIEDSESGHDSDSQENETKAEADAEALGQIDTVSNSERAKLLNRTTPTVRQHATLIVKVEQYDDPDDEGQDLAEGEEDAEDDDADEMEVTPQPEDVVMNDELVDDDEDEDEREVDEREREDVEEDGDEDDDEDSLVDTPRPSRTSLALQTGEDSDGAVSAMPASQQGRPVRRLPGRRRAPNANPRIEAAIRRQLHLRMRFRAVMKGLKPMLAELAKRSLNDLNNDEECHVKPPAYETVKNELDRRLEERLRNIEQAHILDSEFLEQTLEDEKKYRRMTHEHAQKEARAHFIHGLRYDLLKLLRKVEKAGDKHGHASEDEGDGVIPPLRQKVRSRLTGVVLGPEYDSRSRVMIETARHCNDQLQRLELMKTQDEFLGSTITSEIGIACKASFLYQGITVPPAPFTTFDPTPRIEATVKHNLGLLVKASDYKPKPMPIPQTSAVNKGVNMASADENTQALQVLANLSMSRPKLVQGDGLRRGLPPQAQVIKRSQASHMPRRGTFTSGGMPRMTTSDGRARSILNDEEESGSAAQKVQQNSRYGQDQAQGYRQAPTQAMGMHKFSVKPSTAATASDSGSAVGSESNVAGRHDADSLRRQAYTFSRPARDVLSEAEAAEFYRR